MKDRKCQSNIPKMTGTIHQFQFTRRTRRYFIGNTQSRIQTSSSGGSSGRHAKQFSRTDLKFGQSLHFRRTQQAKLQRRYFLGSQIVLDQAFANDGRSIVVLGFGGPKRYSSRGHRSYSCVLFVLLVLVLLLLWIFLTHGQWDTVQ
jgi:hypothetical protein